MRAETAIPFGDVDAVVNGSVGWRHAFGDVNPTQALALAGTSDFVLAGAPIAQNSAVIEAGLDLKLIDAATFGLAYKGQFASQAQEHGFTARLNVTF
ncbi:Extracellular serine protease precursor [compost metagenome]